jgi:hypothetical protein
MNYLFIYLFILIIDELIIYVSLIKLKKKEIIMIFIFLRNQTSGIKQAM